jgi:Ca2+-binding EF-hand superfamily protein
MRSRFVLTVLAAFALLTPVARAFPSAAQIRTAFTVLAVNKDDPNNRDDLISADEWDRASFALFHAADKNGDDFIDLSELAASGIAQDTFARADTDHDGRLGVAEFMALRRAIFQIADIDRDDSLSFVEFELLILMEQVGWVDRNHDGRIELSELKDSLTKAFEQLDTDHDGKLTPAETAFMPAEEFKKFDTNHDGQLSLDEFIAGYRNALLSGS